MENKEIRILLTEDTFSQLCKIGFVSQRDSLGKIDIHFYKNDILNKINIQSEYLIITTIKKVKQ